MNKWQEEVQNSLLESEDEALTELEKQYQKALRDIGKKVRDFQSQIDMLDDALLQEGLDDNTKAVLESRRRSKIYQKQYQEALQAQVNGILDNMHGNNYQTIESYLKECYEDSYVGTLYDISKQGIPVVTPINQSQVVQAVLTDSQINEGLYEALGVDSSALKKTIAQEISRGIATNQSWNDIARNISNASSAPLSRAKLITRTEGNRIQNTASHDAALDARKHGADLVKVWDATLDGVTRPTHRQVDGEVVELDEKFSNGMMFPGDPSGGASEVCNCRCKEVHLPRWEAEGGFAKIDNFTGEILTFDSPEDYAEFKERYWSDENLKYMQYTKALEDKYETSDYNELLNRMTDKEYAEFKKREAASPMWKTNQTVPTSKKTNTNNVKLDISNYSDAFTAKTAEKKNTQALIDYVNNLPDANPDVLNLYNSIGKMDNFEANGIDFSIKHTKNHAVTTRYRLANGKYTEVKLNVPKFTGDNLAGQVNTSLHEQMHLIDLMLKDDPTQDGAYFTASNQKFVDVFKSITSEIGNEILNLFKNFNSEIDSLRAALKAEYNSAVDAIRQQYIPNGAFAAGADWDSYRRLTNKAFTDIMETKYDYEARNLLGGGIGSLQDIYDALSGGKYRDDGTVKYGHGSTYYNGIESRIDEIIANYGALSVTRPDLIEMLRKDKPELVKALDEIIAEMNKKVANIV